MALSRRALAFAARMNVAPDQIRSALENEGEVAAQEVVDALQRIIDDLISTSGSGALQGYTSFAEQNPVDTTIRLPKSGVTLKGKFEWFVTVVASSNHQQLDLNVFNILDSGRKALPKRNPKSEGPYPLWGADSGGRIRGRGAGGSIVKKGSAKVIRGEPRKRSGSTAANKNLGTGKLQATYGPIAATDALNLYDRALKIAKDRLSGVVTPGIWNVVLAQGDIPNG